MFAFGYEKDEGFVFVQTDKGFVFTYPTAALAQESFNGIRRYANIYQLESDLSVACLLEAGDENGAPEHVEPTEEQKIGLWSSYIYKSMLDWAPRPEEVRPCLD